MTTTNQATATTQVYRVHIRATPQAVGDAITDPDLRPGGAYRSLAGQEMKDAGAARGLPVPDVMVDGEVIEAEAPRRLVQTWRLLMDPETAAEGFTRLTYELEEERAGVTKLT